MVRIHIMSAWIFLLSVGRQDSLETNEVPHRVNAESGAMQLVTVHSRHVCIQQSQKRLQQSESQSGSEEKEEVRGNQHRCG